MPGYPLFWRLRIGCLVVACFFSGRAARAQDPLDQAVDAMRSEDTLSANDQQRIAEWVQAQVTQLGAMPEAERKVAAYNAFPQKFKSQSEHKDNKAAFKTQLAVQTATVAAGIFSGPKQDGAVAVALARSLLDMNRVETLPGLLAGLKSSEPAARFLSASGLSRLRTVIAGEKDKLEQVVSALRDAGVGETVPVTVGEIYKALAYPAQAATVFDAYLAIFEKRLGTRRGSTLVDGAELNAFEFFRTSTVLGGLNEAQKAQLAKAVAVFMRLDAERYNAPKLSFDEQDRIERQLDAEEEILTALAPGKTGKVREELATGGHDRRAEVLKQVYAWVGNPESKEAGILNAAPLNVPMGAP